MEPHTTAAQQYFPTYKIDPQWREIGLHEYNLAAKGLEADQRSLNLAAGIVLFFSGGLTTFAGSGSGTTAFLEMSRTFGASFQIIISTTIILVASLSVHYFSQLQRSATYAARKIVVLRRLLGLDYGNVETVLPSDSLDGANEPFSIAMFPGWSSIQAIPAITVAMVAASANAVSFIGFYYAKTEVNDWLAKWGVISPIKVAFGIGIATATILLAFYKRSLFEDFETGRLYMADKVATILRTPIKRRLGHVLYRLRLSVGEADRLKIPLKDFHPLLVFIEDKEFYKSNGNSIRAIIAAASRYILYRSKSGGSTIYQQLARSNFLTTLDPPLRRKILEWLLAPWLNHIFSKTEGLNAYLCSVRFERGVLGLSAAIRHFFPNHDISQPLEPWQRFILIERLSNVSGTLNTRRVNRLARMARDAGYITNADIVDMDVGYRAISSAGKIRIDPACPPLTP